MRLLKTRVRGKDGQSMPSGCIGSIIGGRSQNSLLVEEVA